MCAALALMMRHFFEMFLRARRALEFSNGQGRKQSIATSIAGNPIAPHNNTSRDFRPAAGAAVAFFSAA